MMVQEKKPKSKKSDKQLELPVASAPVEEITPQTKLTGVEFLQKNCMEVSIEINWFATSKQIEGVLARRMLNAVEASTKSVSLSKRLFDSKHPAVQAANKAKQAIITYRDSMTVPAAAVPPQGAVDPKMFLMKEPGTRLILTEMIDEFTEHMNYLVGNLNQAVQKLDGELSSIKHNDMQKLGNLFNDDDYPESISELINVRGPYYKTVSYTLDFERLAPKSCALAMQQLQARLSGTVDLAAADFAQALLAVTSQVANQLGNRVRLMFDRNHALVRYRNAEVVTYNDHLSNPDEVPEGKVLLEVRYTPENVSRSVTEWLPLISREEYDNIKYVTDERKKVHESSVDNLQAKINSFMKIGSMMGEAGKPIAAAVDSLNQLLREGGSTSGDILTEMRDSSSFRKRLNTEMLAVTESLSQHIVAIGAFKPKRRAIGKIKSKVEAE